MTLRASHDGYASDCGVIHTRSIRLSPDGRTLDGEDSFAPVDGSAFPANAGDEFAIRFHLHPAIKASRLADGRGVILLLQDRELWTFATLADEVELEESVFLAGTDGPRRTVQIVIYGRVGQQAAVRWSFRHTPPARQAPDRTGCMSRNCRFEYRHLRRCSRSRSRSAVRPRPVIEIDARLGLQRTAIAREALPIREPPTALRCARDTSALWLPNGPIHFRPLHVLARAS